MTTLQIFILSFIQGLTEFLPISSSGHLVLFPYFLGWQNQGLEMDVALHVGTLIAVTIYFWRDVWSMMTHFFSYCIKGFRPESLDDQVRLALSLVLATLPAVFVGLVLKRVGLDSIRQVSVIASTTIIFGIVLLIVDILGSKKKAIKDITLIHGFLIGLGQAMALVPGVSRSGICISVALILGYTRVASARFAFLMSIPSILGAATLTTFDAIKEDIPILWTDIGLGVLFSMIAGLAAIHFMLTFLARHTLTIFVIYRLLLGIGIWFFL